MLPTSARVCSKSSAYIISGTLQTSLLPTWARAAAPPPPPAPPAPTVAREVERGSGRWATQASPPPSPTSPAPTVSQSLFLRQPRGELRYLLSTEQASIIERLQTYLSETPAQSSRFASLDRFLSIRRGEELGKKSSHLVQKETLFS